MTNVSLALPACAAPLEQKEYLDSIIVVVALPLIKGKSHAPFCRNSVCVCVCVRVITVAAAPFLLIHLSQRTYGTERRNSLLQL
jgi:hypothetical protein